MNALPIPVAILTGFLGSGKTSLLNALLKDEMLSNAAGSEPEMRAPFRG